MNKEIICDNNTKSFIVERENHSDDMAFTKFDGMDIYARGLSEAEAIFNIKQEVCLVCKEKDCKFKRKLKL